MGKRRRDSYRDRKLAEGYPELEQTSTAHFSGTQDVGDIATTMASLGRLVDLTQTNRKVALIGCGPRPQALMRLKELGFEAMGVEPVAGFVDCANEFLGSNGKVLQGSAEALPYADESVSVVILESVLEHVDSPTKSLMEAYRVLAPGGVAFIETTNRLRFHPFGGNGEYRLPFFNYYPRTMKEAFVHHHLHFNPKLANYSTRPAVHWFTFAELCALGREVGFYKFYSRFDGLRAEDARIASSKLKKIFLSLIQKSPLFRFLALIQFGSTVYMLKRPAKN